MSDDLIKRSDAIAEIYKVRTPDVASHQYAELFINAVYRAPSADRPQGEWIEVDDDLISCRCSVCGWEAHLYEDDVYGMPYCPNCGCRMKGADDE